MTHHATSLTGNGAVRCGAAGSLRLALPVLLALLVPLSFVACSGVGDGAVSGDVSGAGLDANGVLDAIITVDTGPIDAAACPGALGCDCADDAACASGICRQGVCGTACEKDCDDSNSCTVDLCVAATSVDASATCEHTAGAAGAACADGTLCTRDDACASGECVGAAVDCDDGSPCTSDWCHPAEGCKHDERDAACDDGDVCTVGDSCQKGGCASGQPQDCEDGNPCTADTCDKTSGCLHTSADGATCDDGDACTSGDTCAGGKCAGGASVACDDGKPCTKDVCDPGTGKGDGGCVHSDSLGAACDDGSVCTIGDACKAGACVSGKAQPCDDGNPCTNDGCDGKKGCVNTPLKLGTSCDDGNACTSGDACMGAGCVAGKALDCNDGSACTKDSCDVTKGCVQTVVDGGKCVPASNSCTVGGVCAAGLCKPVAQIGCDDGQACTQDACDPKSGKCVFTALKTGTVCNDGAACTVGDACQAGSCVGGKSSCDDSNTCTSDSCDGVKGCIYTAIAGAGCSDGDVCTVGDTCKAAKCAPGALQDCTDNNPCTDDLCDAVKGCAPKNNTAPCDDNNACSTKDACAAGACKGGVAKLCDDGNPCTIDLCHPGAAGGKAGCQFIPDDKSGCSDDNVCTTGDACSSGKCVPGKAQLCDDQNVCTVDICNPKKGCIGTPNTASCSDNDVCTVGDVCSAGKCVAGAYQNCDDQSECTVDSCDPKTGCTHTLTVGQCDDGNACTVGDVCVGGKCTPGKDQSCEDANACTNDGCDPVKGCVNVANTAPCDDGNTCSLGDGCSKGACVAGGKIKDCNDLDGCTQDLCYPAAGCKHFANTATCDDGNLCTTSDTCANFKCAAGPKLDCNDQNLCTDDACNPKTGCTHQVNGNKPFGALIDDGSKNSGKWEFKASTGPVRFTHAGTGWYALSAPQNAEHTMTLQTKVDLACAFRPVFYFQERYSGGSHWVEISDDGAKTWSPALIRGNKSDYIWRNQGLDLTGYKGKKVLLRFRAKTTSTNNWWNIRNIAVREADPAPKTVSWGAKVGCENIVMEGPAWTCNADGDTYQLNYKGINQVPDPNLHISTAAFTVRFDVSKVAQPYFTFEERFYYGVLKVETRSPNGAWAEALLRSAAVDYAWRRRVVDLSDFKGDVVELRFTVRSHYTYTTSNSGFHWGDVRRVTFGTKPAAKPDLPFGKSLSVCSDWQLEDAVWACDPTASKWRLQGTSDISTTKAANGYWHYARYLRRIDLTSAKKPQLRFEHSVYYGVRSIDVSEDGGTWTKIWTGASLTDPIWRVAAADLGQFLGKKVWLRIAYMPQGSSRYWRLRHLRVAEAPKSWPVVAFKTPIHDCGAWTPENATWSCDANQATYQFRYNLPAGLWGGSWVALTNERIYKLTGQATPAVRIQFRHYYGSLKVQASADGVQWDDLYSVGNTADLVWRTLTLPLTAYKNNGTVRLRLYVAPGNTAYWGELKGFQLLNTTPPKTIKPAAAFTCAGWTFEGSAWACKTSSSAVTLRYEGQSTVLNVSPNGYYHHADTSAYIDLAGLKHPVLHARIRHWYGELRTYISTNGEQWQEIDALPNTLDLIWRTRAFDLAPWTGKKVFVRFAVKPNNPTYWGEIDSVHLAEYVAPSVAKTGDKVALSDLQTEGGWHYDFIDQRFEGDHTYVNHYQSLTFKKVYDFTSAKKPVLRFEHGWKNGYGYIDVSLDGVAWTSIWTRSFHGRNANVMRPEWVDLSSVNGHKGVHLRFRHYTYNYPLSTGSFWGVNKIQIVEYKAPPTRKAPTTLVAKDFDMRGVWSHNAATGTFSLNKPAAPQVSSLLNSMHFLWPTVALDLTAMKQPILRFEQRNAGVVRYVDVSDDDGQTWQSAAVVARSSAGVWRSVLVDLSPWKASKALLIRPRANLNSAQYWWQLRSLQVMEPSKLKSVGAGYTAKLSDWVLESGWAANPGLNLLERKQYATGYYAEAESTVTWDLSGAKAPKVVYETSYYNASRQMYVSVDGFAWQLVLNAGGTQNTLTTQTVDLTKFAGVKALHVRLKAHISTTAYYWRVKNLKVVSK